AHMVLMQSRVRANESTTANIGSMEGGATASGSDADSDFVPGNSITFCIRSIPNLNSQQCTKQFHPHRPARAHRTAFIIATPRAGSLKLIIGILQYRLKTCAFCAHPAPTAPRSDRCRRLSTRGLLRRIARVAIMEVPLTIRPIAAATDDGLTCRYFLPVSGCRVWRWLKTPSTLSLSAS